MTADQVLNIYDKIVALLKAKYVCYTSDDIRDALEDALREAERKDNGGRR